MINKNDWGSPEAQKLLSEQAHEQYNAGIFEVYRTRLSMLASALKHCVFLDPEDPRDPATVEADMLQWSRAELPLIPFISEEIITEGLWVGRLDEVVGTVQPSSQMIVAAYVGDPYHRNDILLTGCVSYGQFELLNDQVHELDGLNLHPTFKQ